MVWRVSSEIINLLPDLLSSEKTSDKIIHFLQYDWSMKMARCKSRQPFSRDFSNVLLCSRVGANLKTEFYFDNRPFPSCCEPHYESEAKCKAFHMKNSFVYI